LGVAEEETKVPREAASDLEKLADRLLGAIEDLGGPDADDLNEALPAFVDQAVSFVRRYHRLEIDLQTPAPEEPVLFVANHGFGGIFDLNVMASNAALEDLDLDRPVIFLTHQLAWTLGVGRVIEHLGARPASTESAEAAFAEGSHVMVFPGGDVEAAKSFSHRNEVIFGGRSGFARLAMEQKVPIIPIVTAGAGESLLVLSDGKSLAKKLKLDKLLRLKALPVSLSFPWGLSVGAVGQLPYLPLPTKLRTTVLPKMTPKKGEEAAEFAGRVQTAMQDAMTEMTANRRPLLG
jgi:1-acyl-sn-glycerol-3-phosphate acyltransferase